jgi:hypothetical protein
LKRNHAAPNGNREALAQATGSFPMDRSIPFRQGAEQPAVFLPAQTTAPVPSSSASARPIVRDLSTVNLVKDIATEVSHLARQQIELAKAELRADYRSETSLPGGLRVRSLGHLLAMNLVLVSAVLALAKTIPGWQAGLLLSAVVLIVSSITGAVTSNRRSRAIDTRAGRSLRVDVQWTKERLV